MASSEPEKPARNGVVVNNDGPNINITMPGQAVGWGAVEDAVREDDERQVQSCKEDIDSLLTFAGLYSAALTALLALSFGMLQEDVAGESLQVLRQIAQQTANYQLLPGGALNTTAIIPPPSLTPLQPPPAALRVNILWFASLVFSLSTASIGILVKQWLRAYTSYQTSSAQGRMRIRHFRRQGIEVWKVYEIAAVLPFLIQLALGLFFVGLCYFTAGVHPDLGHATLPLVAGWALFIFVVTVLPIVSSHCPYKPALFENLFSIIRPTLFAFMDITFVYLDTFTRKPFALASRAYTFIVGVMQKLKQGLFPGIPSGTDLEERSSGMHSEGVFLGRPTGFPLFLRHISIVARSSTRFIDGLKQRLLPGNPDETVLEQSFLGRLALQARKRTRCCTDINRPFDEADAVKSTGQDLSILVSADALQSDDELLGTAIVDALKQSQLTIEESATFLLSILQSRGIPSDGRRLQDKPVLLDCRSLTLRARTAIADIVAQFSRDQILVACDLHYELSRSGTDQSLVNAMPWILCILLSPSRYPLSPAGVQFLITCLRQENSDILLDYIRLMPVEDPSQTLGLLLDAARQSCMSDGSTSDAMENRTLEYAFTMIKDILDPYIKDMGLPSVDPRYGTIFNDDMDLPSNWTGTLNETSLADTVYWVAKTLKEELEQHGSRRISAEDLEKLISLIFSLSTILFLSSSSTSMGTNWAPDLLELVLTCGSRSEKHLKSMLLCSVRQPARSLRHMRVPELLVHMEDTEVLEHLYQAVVTILSCSLPKTRSVFARLCHILLHKPSHNSNGTPVIIECGIKPSVSALRVWRRIFRRITVALDDVTVKDLNPLHEDAIYLVQECFERIDDIDVAAKYRHRDQDLWYKGDKDPAKEKYWRRSFKSEESPFSNHFVILLSRLLPADDHTDSKFWRLHMVEDMSKEDGHVFDDDEHDDDLAECVDEDEPESMNDASDEADDDSCNYSEEHADEATEGESSDTGDSEEVDEGGTRYMLDGAEQGDSILSGSSVEQVST